MIEQLIICGLAGWRLASLLVHEEGPGMIFANLRVIAGNPDVGEIREGLLPSLFECVWCMSVWTFLLMLALWYVHWLIPGAFAGMAIAVVTERVARRPA